MIVPLGLLVYFCFIEFSTKSFIFPVFINLAYFYTQRAISRDTKVMLFTIIVPALLVLAMLFVSPQFWEDEIYRGRFNIYLPFELVKAIASVDVVVCLCVWFFNKRKVIQG